MFWRYLILLYTTFHVFQVVSFWVMTLCRVKTEAAWPSKMLLVSYHITAQCHNAEDHNWTLHCCENLKSFHVLSFLVLSYIIWELFFFYPLVVVWSFWLLPSYVVWGDLVLGWECQYSGIPFISEGKVMTNMVTGRGSTLWHCLWTMVRACYSPIQEFLTGWRRHA